MKHLEASIYKAMQYFRLQYRASDDMQCNVIQSSYTQSVQKLQFGAMHFNAYNEIQYITEQYNATKYDRSIIQ